MLIFSKIIPDPMFEKVVLNNANLFGGPFFYWTLYKGLNSF